MSMSVTSNIPSRISGGRQRAILFVVKQKFRDFGVTGSTQHPLRRPARCPGDRRRQRPRGAVPRAWRGRGTAEAAEFKAVARGRCIRLSGLNPNRPPVPRVATTAVPETPRLDGERNGFDRNQRKPAAADDPARYRPHFWCLQAAPCGNRHARRAGVARTSRAPDRTIATAAGEAVCHR
jgi:hypothetical protein